MFLCKEAVQKLINILVWFQVSISQVPDIESWTAASIQDWLPELGGQYQHDWFQPQQHPRVRQGGPALHRRQSPSCSTPHTPGEHIHGQELWKQHAWPK